MTCGQTIRLGSAAALSVVVSSIGGSPARSANDVPAAIALTSLTQGSPGAICVVGTSMQKSSGGHLVPAYYLKNSGQTSPDGKPQWIWAVPTSSTQVKALQLEADGAEISSRPPSASKPYVNAGNVRFFFLKSPPAQRPCSSISYTYSNATTGVVNAAYFPYPSGLLEVSTYPLGGSDVMTIDVSNVDSFQIPLQLAFTSGSPASALGLIGNPTTPAFVSRRTLITGPDGNGNGSPFGAWLQSQPGYQSGPNLFAPLVLSSAAWNDANPGASAAGSYPFAMLQSPTDYLVAVCTIQASSGQPWSVPAQCGLNGRRIHEQDPLGHYYDRELAAFFANAKGLVVMGDTQGSIAEQPWTVDSNKADCPAYLKPDGASLSFKSNAPTPIIVCNPLGQVVTLAAAPTNYVQSGSKATVDITAQQYSLYQNKVGWNFGQPETGWIAVVDGFTPKSDGSYRIDLQVLAAPQTEVGNPQQVCSASQCGMANPSFPIWAFSNIRVGESTDPFEAPSRMVFANDGAFSSWLYYPALGDRMIVTQSIERNIVWAFAHGIANCNNVTMAAAGTPPAYCQNATRLEQSAYVAGAYEASDAYWANETNWYPASGPQNYYAQYLHTAQLNASGVISTTPLCPGCFNIFAPPNGMISASAASSQGVPMGMAYGFGFDENPDYLVSAPAQVPSKLDPIPSSWGTGVGVTLTVGRSR